MSSGTQYKAGDIVLVNMQFTDTFEVKKRPGVILFTEFGNIVVAGITSNTDKLGILLTKQDGMIKDSVIRSNYVFTFAQELIQKKICSLKKRKREEVHNLFSDQLKQLL